MAKTALQFLTPEQRHILTVELTEAFLETLWTISGHDNRISADICSKAADLVAEEGLRCQKKAVKESRE